MNAGFLLLVLFLITYAGFSAAIIWHLKTYSFSRSANWTIGVFVALAVFFAALSLILYFAVDWREVFKNFSNYNVETRL